MSVYPAKKLSRNMLFFNFINNGKIYLYRLIDCIIKN